VPAKADQLLVGLCQRSFYEELLEAGVRVHLYRPKFLHAKHVSFDDAVALIGSSNIDVRSFSLNAEVSLIVYDPEVVAALRRVEEENLARCDELRLSDWSQQPLAAQLLQNTARLVDSVL